MSRLVEEYAQLMAVDAVNQHRSARLPQSASVVFFVSATTHSGDKTLWMRRMKTMFCALSTIWR
jgi:hypothetical protein